MRTKVKKSVCMLGLVQMFAFLVAFSNNQAVAQRISPDMARRTGKVLRTGILGLVGGAANGAGQVLGREAASKTIESGKPYIVSWYVQMPNGLFYRVCQNAQNGRYISQPYWCQ